jgi:DNA-binding transcriptional regulator LsrR (DeoR family)
MADQPAESDMAARAAWLHYAGGLTQSAVAERFGIPVTRAHRMIARAAKDGLVRVFVDAEVAGCIALEDALRAAYGLDSCVVAPDIAEADATPYRALGLAAARALMNVLERRETAVIGVGHGRTLSAMVDALPRLDARRARFVSLLGGLTRSYAANPHDVIHRLAVKTGAEGFIVPAPLFANTAEDRAILMSQAGVAEIGRLWDAAEVCFLGIGAVDPEGSIGRANVFDPDSSLGAIRARGARAEVLGHFLDAEGRPLPTRYDGRLIAADFFALRGREAHALAGGPSKVAALDAALRSGVFTGLITDEATARGLVDRAEEAEAPPDARRASG